MEIFISWSGERSKAVATTLKDWIHKVIQNVKPWMSDRDLPPGTAWFSEILERLSVSKMGIVCFTPENINKPWLLFEAGATLKSVGRLRVYPYLFDLKSLPAEHPLFSIQSASTDKEDTRKLIQAINAMQEDRGLSKEDMDESFETRWGELESKFKKIQPPKGHVKEMKTADEKLDEITAIVRGISVEQTRNSSDINDNVEEVLNNFLQERAALPPSGGTVPFNKLKSLRKYLDKIQEEKRMRREVAAYDVYRTDQLIKDFFDKLMKSSKGSEENKGKGHSLMGLD